MWMAKQHKREAEDWCPAVGRVTLSGAKPAVELDSERRELAVYAPGGYRWRPAVGEQVLVLKTEDGPCVTGMPVAGELLPGEVEMTSKGGAAIKLDSMGRVALTGDTSLSGSLTVDGTELTQLIRSIARDVAAAMIRS